MAQGGITHGAVTQPLIDVQNVSYCYPLQNARAQNVEQAPALSDVSLHVQHGEYVALLGHNGSGKSTLARHCNALLLPDQGRVLVEGMNTRDSAKQRLIRERIGMIFQNPDNQLIATVVEDDVAWGLTLTGYPLEAIRTRVTEALEAVNIAHLRYKAPQNLSGGQRQRVAIAGLLALRPACIIADEATSMLDPLSRQEIVGLLYQLQCEHGLSIVHVTHLLEEVVHAQRVVVMEQGKIIQEGTPATIFSDLDHLRALKLIIPEPLALAQRLRSAGFTISRNAMTIAEIAQEVAHA